MILYIYLSCPTKKQCPLLFIVYVILYYFLIGKSFVYMQYMHSTVSMTQMINCCVKMHYDRMINVNTYKKCSLFFKCMAWAWQHYRSLKYFKPLRATIVNSLGISSSSTGLYCKEQEIVVPVDMSRNEQYRVRERKLELSDKAQGLTHTSVL